MSTYERLTLAVWLFNAIVASILSARSEHPAPGFVWAALSTICIFVFVWFLASYIPGG